MPKSNTLKMLGRVISNPKKFASEWRATNQTLAITQEYLATTRKDLTHLKEFLAEAERRIVKLGNEKEIPTIEGRHLNGPPAKPGLPGRQALLSPLRKSMRILEVGAGYNPSAPKREGWNSFSIDHATREELMDKYSSGRFSSSGVPVHMIEEVDFIWTDGPLEAAVPHELWGTFDACIASHLIEHIPNPLGFYNSLDKLIAKGGELLFTVPDKRFTFDFFKPPSTTSEFVQAFFEKRARHTKRTGFDIYALNCKASGVIAWSVGTNIKDIDFALKSGLSDGMATYEKIDQSERAPYVDYHGWVYTPSSFALTALEINALGLTPFNVERSYPTEGCEFYVSLSRGAVAAEDLAAERLRLNKQIIFELAEQAEALRLAEA
jgi:SAM-dependent methyltransferase